MGLRALTLLTIGLVLTMALTCDGTYTITSAYCPVSESAKEAADSVPMPCLVPQDTTP